MKKYIPSIYKSSILDIDYKKLKKENIKCLLFDLDNTLLGVNSSTVDKNITKLVKELKKSFKIVIISNNNSEKRLKIVSETLDVPYVKFALKPFKKGFNAVKKMFDLNESEMCIIGDQIMTDILGGNKYGIRTILVDPLTNEDYKVTGINRFFEKRVMKQLTKKKLFHKGDYYE